jgi:hypothetical protein
MVQRISIFLSSLYSRTRPIYALLFLPLLLDVSCSKRTVSSLPAEVLILEGREGTNWFSLSELRQASDRVLATKGVFLISKEFEVTATVCMVQNSNRVVFQYFSGFGRPFYYVELDTNGKLLDYTNKIATEKH